MNTLSGMHTQGLSSRTLDFSSMRQARFNRIDQDGDQKITKEEMTASRPQGGRGPQVDQIFNKFDTNQDGAIDQAEDQVAFEAIQKEHTRPTQGRRSPNTSDMASALIQKLDSNQDRKLSLDELKTALKEIGETDDSAIEALFKEADADSSSGISQDELAQILEKYKPAPPDQASDRSCYDCHGHNSGSSSTTSLNISLSISMSFSAQA